MRKSGRTPLFRARRLEKILDVGEIYIKLEGANPNGHLVDRIAEMIVMEAANQKCNEILIMGSQNFTQIVRYYAELAEIKPIIPVFKSEKWKLSKINEDAFLDFRDEYTLSQYDLLKRISDESGAYLAFEGKTTQIFSEIATDEIMNEILIRLKNKVDNIYLQMDHGLNVETARWSAYKLWIEGVLEMPPSLFTAQSAKGKIENEADTEILVDDEVLKEAVKVLRNMEHLKLKQSDSLAFGAFYQSVKQGKVEKGTHVIILKDGKTEVKIDNLNDFDDVSKRQLVAYTREWLAQYADSFDETEDAIENANDKGFILLASRNNEYEGVCIVVNLGFDRFIPKYHLAYIGTRSTSKGRGLGTELIQKAIELTEGNLSLHVDLDNKTAKKLYEKLGFVHTYNRMLYKGQ
ncbi:GNAT family N-acetyltransferase [Fusibacter tunisiensis]|uniref:Threonine synthase n=1 Tax=Fusibacter tunisiensis TaxID=1008308 RepID=A0ABS2MRE4_9FIRM|nr:GNAT family N-acetyltransferase [Fusibacter tunisiensis]MBM7561988.1 threonine synthase [Fusibacter tunisiensis]